MNILARENAVLALTAAADQTGKEGYFADLDSQGRVTLVDLATDIPYGVIVEGAAAAGKTHGRVCAPEDFVAPCVSSSTPLRAP